MNWIFLISQQIHHVRKFTLNKKNYHRIEIEEFSDDIAPISQYYITSEWWAYTWWILGTLHSHWLILKYYEHVKFRIINLMVSNGKP